VAAQPADQPVFYYDLGDPECYLVAERVMAELSVVPEWEPVSAQALDLSRSLPDPKELSVRAQKQGLQPFRWPADWPPRTDVALRAAAFAKKGGRTVAFSLAAFRQAFAGGRELDESTVLIAGAACEMHPAAMLKGMGMRSVTTAIETAHDRARTAGVKALPALELDGTVFAGPGCIESASAALDRRALRIAG
jgi:2-hydroxychromene-2-carboxylate isomerase